MTKPPSVQPSKEAMELASKLRDEINAVLGFNCIKGEAEMWLIGTALDSRFTAGWEEGIAQRNHSLREQWKLGWNEAIEAAAQKSDEMMQMRMSRDFSGKSILSLKKPVA